MDETKMTQSAAASQSIGSRIRDMRLAQNMTQDELAAKMVTTKATISKIERSAATPRYDWIEKAADALGVSAASLMFPGADIASLSHEIPVIGLIAAGNWREAIQSPDGFIAVPEAKPYMFALRVHGDSIDLIAPDGAYVAIDPTDPTLADGGVYAVQNGDGEATLKRFRKSPDRLEPESSNPAHKTIMLGVEPITIIGRARSVVVSL